MLVLSFAQGIYIPKAPYFIPLQMSVNYTIILFILVAIVPPALVEWNNSRWLIQVDKNIPRLLMDITESIRSGMPIIKALEVATKRDYGPINEPLEIAIVNFNLTSDLEGSLKWLGEELVRPSGKRMANILYEAYNSGGRMLDVLDTSIQMFNNLDNYRTEKASQISPYILLIYVSSAIFMFISWTVVVQFLQPLANNAANTAGAGMILHQSLDINYYKSILFWAASVEGIFGGLVAGKISTSKVSEGLIHSALLLVFAVIFFSVLLP